MSPTMMKRAFFALTLVAAFTACLGTVAVRSDADYYEVYDAPPPAYIATATPVYYEGYPAYWYNNRWYRRDGARWRSWHNEPVYLREYRTRAPQPVVRQSYGRGQYYGPPPPTYHQAVPVNVNVNPPPRTYVAPPQTYVAPPPPQPVHAAVPVGTVVVHPPPVRRHR